MTEAERTDFIRGIRSQTDKLDFLFQALVKTSRLETGVIQLDKKPGRLFDTVAQAMSGIVYAAEKKEIAVSVDCPEAVSYKHLNSMTELYTMQRYLQDERLQELNMTHFLLMFGRLRHDVAVFHLRGGQIQLVGSLNVGHFFEQVHQLRHCLLYTSYMDVIRDSIENRADDVYRAKEELRTTPVYPHAAAYASEHGEMAQYNLSYQANSACKEAIEQTISLRIQPILCIVCADSLFNGFFASAVYLIRTVILCHFPMLGCIGSRMWIDWCCS